MPYCRDRDNSWGRTDPAAPGGALHAGQRPSRRPRARPQRARGGGERLLRRRDAQRTGGPDGVRPPLRAHDVPGVGERAEDGARAARAGGGRHVQRLHPPGLHELLRGAARRGARAGPVPRGRPDGGAGHHRGEPPQPDRRGEGGDPGQRAQPALRRLPLVAAAADRLRELRQHARRLRLVRRPGVLDRRRRDRLLLPLLRPGQRRPLHRRRPRRGRDRATDPALVRSGRRAAGAAGPADGRAAADHRPLDGRRGRTGHGPGARARLAGSRPDRRLRQLPRHRAARRAAQRGRRLPPRAPARPRRPHRHRAEQLRRAVRRPLRRPRRHPAHDPGAPPGRRPARAGARRGARGGGPGGHRRRRCRRARPGPGPHRGAAAAPGRLGAGPHPGLRRRRAHPRPRRAGRRAGRPPGRRHAGPGADGGPRPRPGHRRRARAARHGRRTDDRHPGPLAGPAAR